MRHTCMFRVYLAVISLGLVCALGAARGDAQGTPVRVLYAASLVSLVEDGLAPGFAAETGLRLEGRPGGSVALAHLILDRLETPDVFISADPDVNRLLQQPGPGPRASWFFTLARTTMVIAYNPKSSFAPALREAATGRRPWYQVLASPGLRLGRTDPELDPKGYRTLLVFRLAERYYHQPGLEERILVSPENPSQIFPEEELVGRLEAGQLDAGVFYLIEATEHQLPYVVLPDAINLGNPAMARAYAQVTVESSPGAVRRGSPILYTVTILSTARNFEGAVGFIQYLYGPVGQAIWQAHGLLPVRILVGGDAQGVPPALRPLVAGSFGG